MNVVDPLGWLELLAGSERAALELSVRHRLPMADSILLATARSRDATLWTQDRDFAGLDGVRYFEK